MTPKTNSYLFGSLKDSGCLVIYNVRIVYVTAGCGDVFQEPCVEYQDGIVEQQVVLLLDNSKVLSLILSLVFCLCGVSLVPPPVGGLAMRICPLL